MAQPFLDVARELIDSPEAKADYAENPDGFLAARGLEGLSAADLEVAVGFVADAVPAPLARQLSPSSLPSAPEPAALARLAATTEVEAEVREAEPGTLGLGAVIDPGGELDLPDSVDFTTLAPPPDEARVDSEAGAEGSNGNQADAVAPELSETDVIDDSDLAPSTLDETPGTDDEVEQDGEAEESEREAGEFDFDPELQPTVESDAGLPAAGPVAAPEVVEPPPEETFEDLI
ncbi:MAG: hypothetical protein ACRDY4_05440 [Acidimicrobiia bacterium]